MKEANKITGILFREIGDTGLCVNPAKVKRKIEQFREMPPEEQSGILWKVAGAGAIVAIVAAAAASLIGGESYGPEEENA